MSSLPLISRNVFCDRNSNWDPMAQHGYYAMINRDRLGTARRSCAVNHQYQIEYGVEDSKDDARSFILSGRLSEGHPSPDAETLTRSCASLRSVHQQHVVTNSTLTDSLKLDLPLNDCTMSFYRRDALDSGLVLTGVFTDTDNSSVVGAGTIGPRPEKSSYRAMGDTMQTADFYRPVSQSVAYPRSWQSAPPDMYSINYTIPALYSAPNSVPSYCVPEIVTSNLRQDIPGVLETMSSVYTVGEMGAFPPESHSLLDQDRNYHPTVSAESTLGFGYRPAAGIAAFDGETGRCSSKANIFADTGMPLSCCEYSPPTPCGANADLQIVPTSNGTWAAPVIDMQLQEVIKQARKKLRNRLAASRCRRKKIERETTLNERVRELKERQAELNEEAAKLRDHLAELRKQVKTHVMNGCPIPPKFVVASA